MCPDTMTDHKTTFLKLNLSEDNKMMFNHWKCNSSLLCNREFTEVVKKTLIIQYLKSAVSNNSNNELGKYWELL